ncbi:MAG: hypothetical protein CENE_00255 [Candidatus Celerinatantimonas neptuna]|nr:MAG: hypothetical protein CENE_00255 [Candidatus Celerinatantimonas neptuna]
MSVIRLSILVLFTLALAGCDHTGTPSVRSICRTSPQICENLNPGGWCNNSRERLIQSRWHYQKSASNKNRYLLLSALNKYQRCIAIIAQIEPTKNKQRKTGRTEVLLSTIKQIKGLEAQVKYRTDLFSLYYRWSQMGDLKAKQQFIAKQNTPQMQDPILLWALATLYHQNDPQKSLHLMKQTLANYKKKRPLPVGILEGIATQYMRLNRIDQAYTWSLVAEKVTGVKTNKEQFNLYRQFSDEQIEQFKNKADHIAKLIHKGQYQPDQK